MEIHEQEPRQPQDPLTTCNICGKIIATHDAQRHMQRFHMPYAAPICEDTGNVHNPGRHFIPKQCPVCGLFFLYLRSIAIHLHTHGLSHSEVKTIMKDIKQNEQPNREVQSSINHGEPEYEETADQEVDRTFASEASSHAEQLPTQQQTIDVQQVLKDLDLENIDFDEEILPNSQGMQNDDVDDDMYCKYCKKRVISWERHVLSNEHKNNALSEHSEGVYSIDMAFNNRIIGFRIINRDPANLDYNEFLRSDFVRANITQLLISFLNQHSALKFQLLLYGDYVKNSDDPEEDISEKHAAFQTSMTELLQGDSINNVLETLYDQLLGQTDEFTTRGSGWALTKIQYIELHINKYSPLKGGAFIELPEFIKAKHACYNPHNNDDRCFQWAIRGHFRYLEMLNEFEYSLRLMPTISEFIHREVTKMKPETGERIDREHQINWDGIEFPITIDRINYFNEMNPSISITVFGIAPDDRTIVGPLHQSKVVKDQHINLLFFEREGKTHFAIVKSLSRLVHSQLGGRQIHREICNNCLTTFNRAEDLADHMENDCLGIVTYLPDPGTKMKFENYANAIQAPMICYADFESVLEKVATDEDSTDLEDTHQKRRHIASSYGFLIKYGPDPSKDYFEVHRGKDCTETFIKNLYSKLKSMFEELVLNNVHPMIFTQADKRAFEQQKNCHICKKPINGKKVRDHDHRTGKFRGAACNECNKKYFLSKEVSVFFHNMSKYDAHLFIEDLSKLQSDRNIEIIPSTDETYISFMKPIEIIKRHRNADSTSHDKIFLKIRFKDSFRFFPGSLEAHAANLLPEQYKNTEKFLSRKYSPELIEKLKRKGVFPYEYIDSFEKYNETNLPSKDMFGSSDGNEDDEHHISEEDYQHAQTVFREAGCRDIGDYNDLYLATDVLILADVFENFRSICINPGVYGLDPAHYYTLPGFSWDAMLKFTNVELELLSDLKMINFVNKGIRGGLSQCSHRLARANNQHMDGYNDKEESSYLIYLDVNNLYGWAMTHHLPIDEFEWMSPESYETNDKYEQFMSIPDDSYHGYILEVDLDYPEALHEKHNDLPFCPDKKDFGATTKLCATLEPKNNYVIHYKNLQQALENGLILKKIHKVLKFHQSPWLEPYINFNNQMRTNATTTAEKDLFKLMNNSIFGKAIENVRKRRNIYLCSSWESIGQRRGAERYIASGYCKRVKVFNENLVAVELAQKSITFNKPIYVGFTVLEISKTRMYDFHYNLMQKKYHQPGQLTLCYMDTDSFIYFIKTDNYYADMRDLIHTKYSKPDDIRTFDTSNYDAKYLQLYQYKAINKKVLGAMKDETGGSPMTLFVGLRAKAYYYEVENKSSTKKAKGVVRRVANQLKRQDYIDCLTNRAVRIRRYMRVFKTRLHQIYTERIKKIALNGADDKRIILHDGIATLAYGHKDATLFELEREFILDTDEED